MRDGIWVTLPSGVTGIHLYQATTQPRRQPHIKLPITAEAATASRLIRTLIPIGGSRCQQRVTTIRL